MSSYFRKKDEEQVHSYSDEIKRGRCSFMAVPTNSASVCASALKTPSAGAPVTLIFDLDFVWSYLQANFSAHNCLLSSERRVTVKIKLVLLSVLHTN